MALRKKYNVQNYPTFQLVNAELQTIDRWMGYEKSYFLNTLKAAMSDLTTLEAKMERFETHPTPADAQKLARYNESQGQLVKAVNYYRQARKLDPGSDYSYVIFDAVASGGGRGMFTLEDVQEAAMAVMETKNGDLANIMQTARTMAMMALQAEKPELMAPYLTSALKRSKNAKAPEIQASRKRLEMIQALHVTKDMDRAVELRREGMPAGWLADSGQLNSFAWWCFENNVNLKEAEVLARKGVELSESGSDKATILDTLAEICNARGTCKDAVYYIEMAIKEDPESDYYPRQLLRFRKILASEG